MHSLVHNNRCEELGLQKLYNTMGCAPNGRQSKASRLAHKDTFEQSSWARPLYSHTTLCDGFEDYVTPRAGRCCQSNCAQKASL